MGILIKQGIYALEQPAPIREWQGQNDPRAKIRIRSHEHVERPPDPSAAGSRL
jgi:hypothetical protein